MVLEFFQYPDANQFFAAYDFAGMESFTMITYDNGQLWDFRWDEVKQQKFIKALDTNACHIWSSATLYEPPIRKKIPADVPFGRIWINEVGRALAGREISRHLISAGTC